MCVFSRTRSVRGRPKIFRLHPRHPEFGSFYFRPQMVGRHPPSNHKFVFLLPTENRPTSLADSHICRVRYLLFGYSVPRAGRLAAGRAKSALQVKNFRISFTLALNKWLWISFFTERVLTGLIGILNDPWIV